MDEAVVLVREGAGGVVVVVIVVVVSLDCPSYLPMVAMQR